MKIQGRPHPERRLILSFSITLLILIGEVIGGVLSNSLALLSDAGHVATDALALGLSMTAARISRRPSDRKATFGYQRVGILAAIINGLGLIAIAVFICFEAYRRFIAPAPIDTTVMLSIAAGGLAGNVLMAFILGHDHEDLNIKSAWLHVIGDTLSSVGVIISGIVVSLTGWIHADPLASVLIGIVIMLGGFRVVREAVRIFLEMVPRGFHVEEIAREIASLPGVLGIHDVHIWSLAHRHVAFTAHIWVHDQRLSDLRPLQERIEEVLRGLRISHTLLQFECVECEASGLYCEIHSGEREGGEPRHP